MCLGIDLLKEKKTCDGKVKSRQHILSYALWEGRTKLTMEKNSDGIPSAAPHVHGIYIQLCFRDTVEVRPRNIEFVVWQQQEAWHQSKSCFNKENCLWTTTIEAKDWVLIYDNSLNHQHSNILEICTMVFGLSEVQRAHDDGTYCLSELNGTLLWVLIVE